MGLYDKDPKFDERFEGYLERIRERKLNPPPPPPPLSSGLMAASQRHVASEGTEYQRDIDRLAENEPFATPEEMQ